MNNLQINIFHNKLIKKTLNNIMNNGLKIIMNNIKNNSNKNNKMN